MGNPRGRHSRLHLPKGTRRLNTRQLTRPDHGFSNTTIIPVWNEIQSLDTAVERTHEFLLTCFDDFEIIIVESGSTDGSYEASDRLAERMSRVSVIHEGAANGFGSAQKLGFAQATKDLVWVVSADLPFPMEKMFEALPLLTEHDCILSYRVDDERSRFRLFQSQIYNNLAKTLLGLRVKHVNSTFKVYKREVIQNLNLRQDGWLIDTEIVFRLQRQGVRFKEIPVPLLDRQAGASTIRPLTPLFMFRDLLKFAISERLASSG